MMTSGQFILSQTVIPVLKKRASAALIAPVVHKTLGRGTVDWLMARPWWQKLLIGTAAAPTLAKGIEKITPDYPKEEEEKKAVVAPLVEEEQEAPKKTDQEISELSAPPMPVNKAEHVDVPPPSSPAEIPGANVANPMEVPTVKYGYQLMRHADATAQLLNTFK